MQLGYAHYYWVLLLAHTIATYLRSADVRYAPETAGVSLQAGDVLLLLLWLDEELAAARAVSNCSTRFIKIIMPNQTCGPYSVPMERK